MRLLGSYVGSMTQMSMNKVIHGAVRRDLDRFVGALSGFPAGDQKRRERAGHRVGELRLPTDLPPRGRAPHRLAGAGVGRREP